MNSISNLDDFRALEPFSASSKRHSLDSPTARSLGGATTSTRSPCSTLLVGRHRARASVEVKLPVARHGSGRTGYGLVGRMTIWRGQSGSFEEFAGAVVVEPVLARFEALQHWVPGGLAVGGRVLTGRVIATTDVPTGRAAAQVEPPTRRRTREALLAASPGRRHTRIDPVRHTATDIAGATPLAVRNSVSRTSVSSRYRRLTSGASPVDFAGAMRQNPCDPSPSSFAKQAGESKRGRQRQSIEPSRPISAAVWVSPISP